MAPVLSEEARAYCRANGFTIEAEAHIGFINRKKILLEQPVEIRRGIYDIDKIGAYTYLGGRETFMRHIGSIGRFCSIASNIVTGQIEHPTNFLTAHSMFTNPPVPGPIAEFHQANQAMIEKARAQLTPAMKHRVRRINIGNDVWIGEGVYIRRGVTIGDGAVIATRAVVASDVPPYAIVGGTPAKLIRYRFDPHIVADLRELAWWKYGLSALHDVDFTDISQAISVIGRNIASGRAAIFTPAVLTINDDGSPNLQAST